MSNGKIALLVSALLPELGAPEALHLNALEPGGAKAQRLSGRERDILHLIAQGRVDREIAQTLAISPTTVKSHVGSILNKLHASSRSELIALAYQARLVNAVRATDRSLGEQV